MSKINPIINYLNYWILAEQTYPHHGTVRDKAAWRRANDLDVIHLDGDLHADTIFSLWMPLKMVLECLNPNEKFYKKNKYGSNPNLYLEKIKMDIDKYLNREMAITKELYCFAELALTRANVMRLPNRRMQNRGIVCLDQMPRTLYECFIGGEKPGAYSKYFESDESVRRWVEKERLEMFFCGDISKGNIKPLISRMKSSNSEWLVKNDEILEMLKQYNEIIKERGKKYCEHVPQKESAH